MTGLPEDEQRSRLRVVYGGIGCLFLIPFLFELVLGYGFVGSLLGGLTFLGVSLLIGRWLSLMPKLLTWATGEAHARRPSSIDPTKFGPEGRSERAYYKVLVERTAALYYDLQREADGEVVPRFEAAGPAAVANTALQISGQWAKYTMDEQVGGLSRALGDELQILAVAIRSNNQVHKAESVQRLYPLLRKYGVVV